MSCYFFIIKHLYKIEANLPSLKQLIKQTQLVILWHIAENAHFIHFFNQG